MLVCDVTYASSICSEAFRCARCLRLHVCKCVRAYIMLKLLICDVTYAPSICSEASRCATCLRLHVCKCVRAYIMLKHAGV